LRLRVLDEHIQRFRQEMDEIEGLWIVEHHLRERESVSECLMPPGIPKRIKVGMMPSPRDLSRLPVLGRLVGQRTVVASSKGASDQSWLRRSSMRSKTAGCWLASSPRRCVRQNRRARAARFRP
jgi:hypothetical protein